MLEIKNLHVTAEEKEILKGIDLEMPAGEVHVIMGPNGSGKSTLANTLAGHPKYAVTDGEILLDGKSIAEAKVDERARAGLFLSMQYPPEVEGVTIASFLRTAKQTLTGEQINPLKFHKELSEQAKKLHIDKSFLSRYLNVGFSGGEKKKFEILQLLVLDPKLAVLDETDSGLDVDALRIVAEGVNGFKNEEKGILLITHYNRILRYVQPDRVHVMEDGKIVKSGGAELAKEVEEKGYM